MTDVATCIKNTNADKILAAVNYVSNYTNIVKALTVVNLETESLRKSKKYEATTN